MCVFSNAIFLVVLWIFKAHGSYNATGGWWNLGVRVIHPRMDITTAPGPRQVDFRIIVTANLRDPNLGDDDADIQIGSNKVGIYWDHSDS